MANPLDQGPAKWEKLKPGESRTFTSRHASGAEKTITIQRTSRPYIEDLCDAYNAGMSETARARGLEWQIAPNGELKLDYSRESMARNALDQMEQREKERQAYIRRLERPLV